MTVVGSVRTAVLLAFLVSTARAQPATLSYVGADPCCIAVDGNGNNFVVSFSELRPPSPLSDPLVIWVTKLDPSGKVVSNFPLEVGTGDFPAAAAVDSAGNLWIVGGTPPPPYPPPPGSAPTASPEVGLIVKLDNTGANVLFAGTFGGMDPNGTTIINAIAFDSGGNLYIAGSTSQLDFPATAGAFTSQIPSLQSPSGLGDRPTYGFIARLAPDPNQTTPPYTVTYSTLLGGQQVPFPLPVCSSCFPLLPGTTVAALAVDANGLATVTGVTDASDFPVTAGAFQTQFQGADNTPNLFVTRLNAQGTALIWSTFLGEGNSVSPTTLGGMALDSSGDAVLAGVTSESNFPVTSGALQPGFTGTYDSFIAKLDSTGAGLLFSTFYGESNYAAPPKLRLDAQGDIWITEPAPDPSGLLLHPNSLVLGGNLIAELAPDGSSVLFSELLPDGVAGQDLVLNPDGSLTVIGPPQGEGFIAPISTGFALRLPRATPTGVSILGVADSAVNAVTNTVAPGEYVSIYGTGLGPAAGVGQIVQGGVVSSSLGGTQVSIGGVLAPLIYASTNQINLLVPYEAEAALPLQGSVQVNMTITSAAGTSQTLPLQVVPVQPNIFVVLNSDGSVNSASNPAAPFTTISIFVSGAGALSPSLPDGTIASSPAPAPALSVQADFYFTIFEGFSSGVGVDTVTPAYAGSIPGMPIDMLRVDARAPNLDMMGPPPFGIAVGVDNSISPQVPFYVANVPD